MRKNAKRKLERRLAEGGGNNRPFYSYVRNKTKNRVGVGPLKDGAGHLVSDNKEMASMLNSYFSSVFTTEMDEPPEIQDMVEEAQAGEHHSDKTESERENLGTKTRLSSRTGRDNGTLVARAG